MSWVLILTPMLDWRGNIGHPAIVGGYRTRVQAEAAGRVAIARDADFDSDEWRGRLFKDFVVIPGGADAVHEAVKE